MIARAWRWLSVPGRVEAIAATAILMVAVALMLKYRR